MINRSAFYLYIREVTIFLYISYTELRVRYQGYYHRNIQTVIVSYGKWIKTFHILCYFTSYTILRDIKYYNVFLFCLILYIFKKSILILWSHKYSPYKYVRTAKFCKTIDLNKVCNFHLQNSVETTIQDTIML